MANTLIINILLPRKSASGSNGNQNCFITKHGAARFRTNPRLHYLSNK